MVCSQSKIELRWATYNSSMERIVTRGQGSGDSHGHIPRTDSAFKTENPSWCSINVESIMNPSWRGHRASLQYCFHSINWIYIVNFIKSRSLLIDFEPQNGFFIDSREKRNMSTFVGFLCNYAQVSIPWEIKKNFLGWQLCEIHVQQNPHARGLHLFRWTSDLKQIYSTWNQFTEIW